MLPDTSRAKTDHRLVLHGCDDRTDVEMALTADEFAFVKRLAEATEEASTSECQPTIAVLS